MVDISQMRLGKLAPKPIKHMPMLAAYTTQVPKAPVAVDWTDGLQDFGQMQNDVLGNCTCAAVGHAIQIFTKNASTEQTLSDADVVHLYEQFGYTPSDPSSDAGAVETDVLNYWLKHPIASHKLDGFVGLQPQDLGDIKDAIWLLGGAYIGVALPATAQGQVGSTWVVTSEGLAGDGAPGSWGGHAVFVAAYDAHGLTCITWGKLQRMSWNFWKSYCDEAYGLLSPDWIKANGVAPSGFDLAMLTTDMRALREAA